MWSPTCSNLDKELIARALRIQSGETGTDGIERYGAEVVTVANDVIEFRVSRPPRTPEEAQQLAIEQYLYCIDIVDRASARW